MVLLDFFFLYLVVMAVLGSLYGLSDSKTVGFINYAILFLIIIFIVISKISFDINSVIILSVFLLFQMFAFIYSNNYLFYKNSNLQMPVSFAFNYFLFFTFPLVKKPNPKFIYKSIHLMIGIGITACIYEFIFKIQNLGNVFKFFLKPSFTIQSFYLTRNAFGLLMAVCILLCVFMYLKNGKKIRYALIGTYFLLNLIMTLSRASYITVAAFVFFFLLMNTKKRLRIILVSSALVLAAVLLYFNNPHIQYFVDTYMIRADSGVNGRNTIWKIALHEMDVWTVLFGKGLGISRVILDQQNFKVTSFHNIYLEMMLSGGVMYFLLFLYMLKTVFRKIKQLFPFDKESAVFFIACILSFMVYGFFEVSMLFYLDLNCLLETFLMITLPILYTNAIVPRKDNGYERRTAVIGDRAYI